MEDTPLHDLIAAMFLFLILSDIFHALFFDQILRRLLSSERFGLSQSFVTLLLALRLLCGGADYTFDQRFWDGVELHALVIPLP